MAEPVIFAVAAARPSDVARDGRRQCGPVRRVRLSWSTGDSAAALGALRAGADVELVGLLVSCNRRGRPGLPSPRPKEVYEARVEVAADAG